MRDCLGLVSRQGMTQPTVGGIVPQKGVLSMNKEGKQAEQYAAFYQLPTVV